MTGSNIKIGDKFGKLTITSSPYKVENRLFVDTLCDCGNIKERIRIDSIKSGTTKSCGCLRRVKTNKGESSIKSRRLYRIWSAMKQRCHNPKSSNFHNYGAKGISVCNEWKNSFLVFQDWALSNKYEKDLQIDRISNSGNYSPDNCRWVTHRENTQKMLKDHKEKGTGIFSKLAKSKAKKMAKDTQGIKFKMYLKGDLISSFNCLMDAAEFICEVKKLTTKPIQVKKNISACLNKKRKTCHGYTFELE